jgi:hypothetical protein
MNYNLIGKNSFGAVIVLLLVILLSQSQFFDFLIHTSLGRFFLIGIVLLVSCIHKIFGIISVLFIIIIFNNSDFSFLEGMKGMSLRPETFQYVNRTNKKQKQMNVPHEGTDVIGKERQIQKGRDSNTIPVNDYMKKSDNLHPHDSPTFSEIFSPY